MLTPESPSIQLLTLSRGYVVSRAIHAIARLDIADYLSEEIPVDVNTLASKSGTKPLLLERLMDFLTAQGLFRKNDQGFMLTPLSKPLQANDPQSVKAAVKMVDNVWWEAFAWLDKGLQSGIPPFNHAHQQDFFDFLQTHPDKQENFDAGMAKLSSYDDDLIADACDFGKFESLMDIGGGKGGLIKALARRFPRLPLILFETTAVLSQLNQNDFPAHVTLQEGNFLEDIPRAQAYFCRGVLHDFNDEMVLKILHNCRKKMDDNAALFIAEQVIPDIEGPHPNKTMDIVMMVLLGGRQRTLSGWEDLLKKAGFHLHASYPTKSLFMVMEFRITERL